MYISDWASFVQEFKYLGVFMLIFLQLIEYIYIST